MEETKLELVISEQTLGTLTTNAKELKAIVKNNLSKYSIDNYNEDNIEDAKKDKALLNNAAKTLNDKRIQLEKDFLKPFDDFKSTISDTINLIKTCSSKIDGLVKTVDDKFKQGKKENIQKYYESLSFHFVPFEKFFDSKWLNKTVTMKSVYAELGKKIEQVRTDLKIIENIGSDVDQLKSIYLNELDLAYTIEYSNKLKEASKKVEETTKTEDKVDEDIPVRVEQQDDQYMITFTCFGNRQQLIALSNFMNNNKIKFVKNGDATKTN